MEFMDVSVLPGDALKIKGKQALFFINSSEKVSDANAVVFLTNDHAQPDDEAVVVIDGPGDYEIGGVKLSGIRSGDDIVYSFIFDGINIMIGKIAPIEKIQHKVKEHDAVIIAPDETSPTNASFITGLATNYLVAVGSNGKKLVDSFGGENPVTTNKLSLTKDKLPQEMQTVLLASS
jgi:hypothetical protein